jgi:predicted ArsR family transcriptional regulator
MSSDYEKQACERVLPKLVRKRGQTARQLRVPSVTMTLLERAGHVCRVEERRNGKPGRPAILWAATDKGRKRGQRIAARRQTNVAA